MKTLRLILACTILLPVWIFMSISMLIFPGCIVILMGLGSALGKLLLFKVDMDWNDIATMIFFPFVAGIYAAIQYAKTGDMWAD